MGALIVGLLIWSFPLPLNQKTPVSEKGVPERSAVKIPARFWIYAAFALTYGICETMSANWSTIYMAADLGASTALASAALTVFWVSVTGGRVLFAAIEKWCPPRWTYRMLPIFLAMAFLATASTPKTDPFLALIFFGFAGFGCSALLPLVISFGQKELTSMSASVAGGLIGFYQMGYGIAAFGVGPVQSLTKITLGSVYGWATCFAVLLAVLAFVIVGWRNLMERA
jgi:predicted MFS family arabinose efflux permease